MALIEFVRHHVDDYVVPIFSPEAMIPIGREHLDLMLVNAHDSYVKSAATQIENKNRLILVQFIKPVGQSPGRRLVVNLGNVKSGGLAGRDGSGGRVRVE